MGEPLSQEEIDKLLAQSAGADAASGETSADAPAAESPAPEAPAEEAPEAPVLQVAEFGAEEQAAPDAGGAAAAAGAPSAEAAAQPDRGPKMFGAAATMSQPDVRTVQFGNLPGPGHAQDQTRPIDLLLDVRLQLTVELGRKDLTIKDALGLGPGSVVELDHIAGEPVDVLVNNKLIARGEVVVIDENFGVRVTEVVSPSERTARIG